MFELAGVTFAYGESKRAYLNPATLLHIVRITLRMVGDLRNGKFMFMRGIIFIFSENGCMSNLEVAISFLPGGYRNYNNGDYNNMSNNGYLWSASESGSNAWNRKLNYNNTNVNRNNNNKQNGFSVRCVRDSEFNIISLLHFLLIIKPSQWSVGLAMVSIG